MKILFVQQDTCLYGASKSLLVLIDQLVCKGHKCMVLLPRRGALIEEFDKRKVPYAITPWRGWTATESMIPVRRVLSGLKGALLNKFTLNRAKECIEGFDPDIIHTNSSKTAFGAMLAKKLGVKHTWHFREFLGGEFSVGQVFSFGRRLSCEYINKRSSAIVVISNVLKKDFDCIDHKSNINLVYNGAMPLSEMKETASTTFPDFDVLKFALIGRFSYLKQPMVALEAVKILWDRGVEIKLLIAGSGEPCEVEMVKEYIQKNKLDALVEMKGFVKNICDIYSNSHALLMPSIGDAFGRVTAEAMAFGRPVIGANACATAELVKDGYNGLLFHAGDSNDLADKIEHLVIDKHLVREYGANASKSAICDFTAEKYAENMENIFTQVLNESTNA